MSDGVRADIIYFNTSSDWLFESELYSKYYSLRLLTATASSKLEAIKALGRALSRSETVVVVGGWQGETYLPATIAKAVGISCQRVGLAGSAPEDAVLLPSGAMPLALDGKIRGAILCRGPQAIILIDDARQGRASLAKEYIAPYLIKQAGLIGDPKPQQKAQADPSEEKASVIQPGQSAAKAANSVEKTAVAEAKELQATKPEKSAEKKADLPKKSGIEEIPMERVRLVLPKKKATSTGLPELKFTQGIKSAEQAGSQSAEKVSTVEEIAVEPIKQMHQKEENEQSEAPIERKPKKSKSVAEVSALPTEKTAKKQESAEGKPEEQEKSAEKAKPAKMQESAEQTLEKSKPEPTSIKREKAVVEPKPVLPEQADEVRDNDEGIELPRFNKVLTVICILVLLAALAAALYIGYKTFVLGGVDDALAALEMMKVRNL